MTPTTLSLNQRLEFARDYLRKEKPKKLDPAFQFNAPLQHGWLRPYLLAGDAFTWQRWAHWMDVYEAGRLTEATIPQIEWSNGQTPARKHLEHCLDAVTKYGGWLGWSSQTHFNYFLDWLLFALGDHSQPEEPKEGQDQLGASARLYQLFNLNQLLVEPYDYFGDILAESQHGRRSGFFPTPLHVCEMMVRMQMDGEDMRDKTVCDPALGTGRMLLCASNHSYRLYGMDIDPLVLKACKVNLWLFAPWGIKPFPFFQTYASAHENAPAVPNLTLTYKQAELIPA